MHIGLYGGAFNPPHVGHLQAIAHALSQGTFDEIWVLPCWGHAFGKNLAPFEDRIAMTRLAVEKVFIKAVVKSYEGLFKTTYTIDLIENVKSSFPDHDFSLIIGEDNLKVVDKWHRWDDITKQVGIFVVPELHTTRSTQIREALKGKDNTLSSKALPPEVLVYVLEHALYQ